MTAVLPARDLVIAPGPAAYFGAGAIARLPAAVQAAGETAVIVTDAALAATPVVAAVTAVLAAAGIGVSVFSGVHPNPTTQDLADGATAVEAAGPGRPVLVAIGGGSPIDAAKGIALAAVNPQRGRLLDYRSEFAVAALRIVAVPTTAGTGAETNAFGVVTDESAHRKFYVGHASTLPAAAILDPDLTTGLPPRVTAATGMDALTHALESYLSVRANPLSAGLALRVIEMVGSYLPRAYADGTDAEARAQLLLAAHLAGLAMATTGLGACHAIGHALGGRYGIAHGVALSLVLPQVLAFSRPTCTDRLSDVAFALGAGSTGRTAEANAGAAIDAVAGLAAGLGLTGRVADFGITAADFGQIAADALDDEVLMNAPRQPSAADVTAMLAGAGRGAAAGSGQTSMDDDADTGTDDACPERSWS
jgi:alcohol dehydrogenase